MSNLSTMQNLVNTGGKEWIHPDKPDVKLTLYPPEPAVISDLMDAFSQAEKGEGAKLLKVFLTILYFW